MFEIQGVIISLDIIEKCFACNLQICKGQCCIDGDAGAPLDKNEAVILDKNFKLVLPFLPKNSQNIIKQQRYEFDNEDKEYVTPLVNNRECAYAIKKDGITFCGIEKAYEKGKIDFKKPISCHLYPIRLKKYVDFISVNYDKWDICNNAVKNGILQNIRIYEYLKEPLIRKFGKDWYIELEQTAKEWLKKIDNK